MANWWSIVVVVIVMALSNNPAEAGKSEKDLINHIIKQAGGSLGRPVKDPTDPLTVYVKLFLNQIINEPDNSLTTVSFMLMTWEDQYIGWNPSHYGGKTVVSMPVSNFWHPDVFSIKDGYTNFDDQHRWMKTFQAFVYYNGTVAWNVVLRTRNLCSPKKGYFYKKICTFQLGSLSYPVREVKLKFLDSLSDFDMGQYVATPGIKILSHSAERVVEPYDQPRPNTLYYGLNYNLVVKLYDGAVKRFPIAEKNSSSSQHYSNFFNIRRKMQH